MAVIQGRGYVISIFTKSINIFEEWSIYTIELYGYE